MKKGFSHIEILIVAIVIAVIVSVGVIVSHSKSNAKKSLKPNTVAKATTISPPKSTTVTPTKTVTPTTPTTSSPPAVAKSTPVTVTPKSSARVTHTTQTPTPPAPVSLTPSLAISDDGCTITATGTQGFLLSEDYDLPGHHGGHSEYPLPSNGVLHLASWAETGGVVDAYLSGNGAQLFHVNKSNIAADCPHTDPADY